MGVLAPSSQILWVHASKTVPAARLSFTLTSYEGTNRDIISHTLYAGKFPPIKIRKIFRRIAMMMMKNTTPFQAPKNAQMNRKQKHNPYSNANPFPFQPLSSNPLSPTIRTLPHTPPLLLFVLLLLLLLVLLPLRRCYYRRRRRLLLS